MPNNSNNPASGPSVPITNPQTERLLDESREIVDRQRAGSLKPIGAENKLKEGIGEFGTRNYAERTFGKGNIKSEVLVIRRGTAGAPVLDVVYELHNGDFVVLEAKYNEAQLGKVNERVFQMGDTGPESIPVRNPKEALKATIKVNEGAVGQFSPKWFQDRIHEIRARGDRQLAKRLQQAWDRGKIHAHVVRVDKDGWGTLDADGDKTNRWKIFKQRAIPVNPTKAPHIDQPNSITNDERGLKGRDPVGHQKPSKPSTQVVPRKLGIEAARETLRATTLGVKVWRVTRRIGSILIKAFLPLTVLDLVIEIALLFWDAERDKDERDERDKQQVLEKISTDKYLQALVEDKIRSEILTTAAIQESFIRLWNEDEDFPGFLYARLEFSFEKIAFFAASGKEIADRTKYFGGSLSVLPAYSGHADHVFELTKGEEKHALVTSEDKEKYGKRDLDRIGKKARQPMILKYTIPTPIFTPFDIVITKINNLFLDIVYFIGAFSGKSDVYMQRFQGFNYRGNYRDQFSPPSLIEFPDPLYKPFCDFSLKYLHSAARHLSRHPLKQNDIIDTIEDPKKGYLRRHGLLMSLTNGKGEKFNFDNNFDKFTKKFSVLVKDSAHAPQEIKNAINELYTGARSVWYDLRRIETDMLLDNHIEYYYYGPKYKKPK
jgi:hypothetical protein